MAIAVFTDIHGNLEALEAILADIKKKRIKQIFFLGDAVCFGSDSSACLKLLAKHNVQCVVGNNEQRLFRYDKSIANMTFGGRKHAEYIYHSLDNDDIRFIKSMPLSRSLDYKGYRLHFCHYGHDDAGVVREDMDVFNEAELDKMFGKVDADVVFFGHLHVRKIYIRPYEKSYFMLASSGLRSNDTTYYTYFDVGGVIKDNYDIHRIKVTYDRKKFEQKMRERDIPEKALFGRKFFGLELE